MNPEHLRDEHFRRLNAYRQSAEYADYAKAIGATPPSGNLPSLIGDRWEIDKAIYDEFLEMLPPLGWKDGSFYMREFSFGDVTAKFTKEGDRYFCEFARYPAKHADRESSLGDLLTNLMHWADRNGQDFSLALARAQGHYETETGGEAS